MSNLSNLYISESYYGVVNLIDSTEPFVSQSEGRIYLTDGLGENLGVAFDYTKRVSIDNGLTITGSLLVSGSKILTGSLDVLGDITASGTVSAGTGSFDTINARLIHTTIESSSIIYSTGSNILGDDASDVQTLNGTVNVPNLHYLAGNPKDTNLRIDEKLFTSSFDSFSSSLHTEQLQQDQDLVNLSSSVDTTILALSSSVSGGQYIQDGRITALENFSSSLVADFVTDVEYSASIAVVTSSLYTYIDNQDAKKLDTGSFNTYSSSIQGELDLKSDLTGNNTFVGNNTFSGSVNGGVIPLSIVSSTASMDCSQGNFFTLQLVSGSTHLSASNIQPGQTLTLEITQTASGDGTLTFSNVYKFAEFVSPTISVINNANDIMTFVTFGTNKLYSVIQNNFS